MTDEKFTEKEVAAFEAESEERRSFSYVQGATDRAVKSLGFIEEEKPLHSTQILDAISILIYAARGLAEMITSEEDRGEKQIIVAAMIDLVLRPAPLRFLGDDEPVSKD